MNVYGSLVKNAQHVNIQGTYFLGRQLLDEFDELTTSAIVGLITKALPGQHTYRFELAEGDNLDDVVIKAYRLSEPKPSTRFTVRLVNGSAVVTADHLEKQLMLF